MRRVLALTTLFALLHFGSATACTVLAVADSGGHIAYVGRSYDWGTQAAEVVSNKTGITKRALVFPTDDPAVPTTALSWTSKIPSITFNMYGREITTGGMNKDGLVVETAEMDPGSKYLRGTIYEPSGATEVINSNQWVQYILDTFTSVDDFLAPGNYPPAFAIMPDTVPVQFMVCDTSKCVVVEIKDNKLVTTQGTDLGVKLSNGDFVPVNALTNDYYDCSVKGLNGDTTLALEDYTGYGGTRPVPSGPEYCQDLPAGRGCDSACRTSASAWYQSNSVERFVRAAAGSRALSGTNPAVGDVFKLLNDVFSTDGTTGATMWQIVYAPQKPAVFWRTIADGCNLDDGFTGAFNEVGFDNFASGDGKCTVPDNTKVLNIDQARSCSAPLPLAPLDQVCASPLVTCNPISSLPSCVNGYCEGSAYSQQINHDLVKFAAENSEVDMAGFAGMIKNFLKGVTDDQAKAIMYNIWGGYPGDWEKSYPVGFTACNGDVTPEGIVNLYLAAAKDPYINLQVNPAMDANPLQFSHHDNFSWSPVSPPIGPPPTFTFSYDVSGKSTGQDAHLTNLHVTNDSPADKLTIEGNIENWKSTGSITLTAQDPILVLIKKMITLAGTANVTFNVNDFTVDMLGAHASYDESSPLCLDKNLTVSKVSYQLGNVDCSLDLELGPFKGKIPLSDICKAIYKPSAKFIQDAINTALRALGPTVANDSFPQCGDTTVAAPAPPPTLTAGWGGLEGQYVTARAGHTYLLDGLVHADRDSFSHEFATFSETLPGAVARLHLDTVRMRANKGDNTVETVWTPDSPGEYELFFDVSRWDGPIDEVTPAVLHVDVLPPNGPASWQDLTKEGLSKKFGEVK